MQTHMVTIELESDLAEEALELLEQVMQGTVALDELTTSLALGHLRYRLEQAIEQY